MLGWVILPFLGNVTKTEEDVYAEYIVIALELRRFVMVLKLVQFTQFWVKSGNEKSGSDKNFIHFPSLPGLIAIQVILLYNNNNFIIFISCLIILYCHNTKGHILLHFTGASHPCIY